MLERRRGLNRKGDVTITTVILIILGIVVLVMLIVGLTKGFDFLFGNIDTVDPGKLQVLASACQGYAQGGLKISYCQFKEVDTLNGVKQVYNCDVPVIEGQMSGVTPLDCDAGVEKTFCDNVAGDKNKVNVFYKNGAKTCQTISVEPLAACDPASASSAVGNAPCECGTGESAMACKTGQACIVTNTNKGECKAPVAATDN